MRFCANCGNPLKEGDQFCIKCGTPVPVLQQSEMDQEKAETALDKNGDDTLENKDKTCSEGGTSSGNLQEAEKTTGSGTLKKVMAIIIAVVVVIGAIGAYKHFSGSRGKGSVQSEKGSIQPEKDQTSLEPVEELEGVKSISLGYYHSAALMEDGSLWVWGSNGSGQIGDGTTHMSTSIPVQVMDDVESVSLGGLNTAAITTDGSLWVWGADENGQLGSGEKDVSADEDDICGSNYPIQLLDNVKSVSVGWDTSAAIRTDGSLWTWGDNTSSQIGNGKEPEYGFGGERIDDVYAPVKVMEQVNSVSMGAGHSAAIKTDGSLWMWGDNTYGQLGDGATASKYAPVKVMDDVESVALGADYSAAIKTDGSLWMWGRNDHGQLCDGTTTDQHTPVKVMDDVESVAVHTDHTAVIKTDGSLWMCGNNEHGKLGDGTTTEKHELIKVMDDVKSVSLGCFHSAALKEDGTMWAWGRNDSGELGDCTATTRPTPVKINIPPEVSDEVNEYENNDYEDHNDDYDDDDYEDHYDDYDDDDYEDYYDDYDDDNFVDDFDYDVD